MRKFQPYTVEVLRYTTTDAVESTVEPDLIVEETVVASSLNQCKSRVQDLSKSADADAYDQGRTYAWINGEPIGNIHGVNRGHDG